MVKYQIYVECLEQSIRFQAEAREGQEAAATIIEAAVLETAAAEEGETVVDSDVPSGRSSVELQHLEVPAEDESCPNEVAVIV